MNSDQPNNPFMRVRAFEWDEEKRLSNLLKHGIDFYDVRRIVENDLIVGRSDRLGEERYEVFGIIDREVVAVVCTIRSHRCRWISARRASKNEREKYYRRVAGRAAQG
jgi:uncharacterized DUF497 family protein